MDEVETGFHVSMLERVFRWIAGISRQRTSRYWRRRRASKPSTQWRLRPRMARRIS